MNLNLKIVNGDPANPVASGNKTLTVRKLVKMLEGMANGTQRNSGNSTLATETSAVAAAGTVTLATASGDVTATINGVAVTVSFSFTDANTASLLASAINLSENALVNKHVSATSLEGVITLTAKTKGYAGNAVTLAASGTGATASGARLTGGSSTDLSFSF